MENRFPSAKGILSTGSSFFLSEQNLFVESSLSQNPFSSLYVHIDIQGVAWEKKCRASNDY